MIESVEFLSRKCGGALLLVILVLRNLRQQCIFLETKQKEKSGAEPLKEFVLQANWCCL